MNGRLKGFAGGIAAAFAVLMLSGPALADGYRSVKDAPKPEARRCNLSANIALTTEYVFRGFSQTAEGPAVQGGFDVTCGIFYAGVWASSLDFGGDAIWGGLGNEDVAHIEMDWYLGIKPVTGKITWDLGVIYYTYPNSIDPIGRDLNYVEIKVGASAEIWKDGTLGVTVFWIEHIMQVLMKTCEHLIVLHHGEKLAEGAPQTVAADRTVAAAYFGKKGQGSFV